MAVLHIIWWTIILVAVIGFMFLIKPLADIWFPVDDPKEEQEEYKPTWLCKEDNDEFRN